MNLPKIENAFQNIKNTCQKRLEEIYPKGIPEDINSRYAKELFFLERSDLIDDFEIFRRLSEETKKSSTIISVRGTLAGSILYFLLGNNSFNPIPHITIAPNAVIMKQWIHTYLELIFHKRNVHTVIRIY